MITSVKIIGLTRLGIKPESTAPMQVLLPLGHLSFVAEKGLRVFYLSIFCCHHHIFSSRGSVAAIFEATTNSNGDVISSELQSVVQQSASFSGLQIGGKFPKNVARNWLFYKISSVCLFRCYSI